MNNAIISGLIIIMVVMFNKYSFVLIILFFSFTAFAQDDYEDLLSGKKIKFSVFASPIFEISSVHNSFGFSSGGGGALLLNQTLFIGGYGLKLAPVIGEDITIEGVNYQDLEVAFNHGGLWFGYISNFRKLIHFGASAKFGWGKIVLDDRRLVNSYEDNVLVITPQLEAEVNISKWFKINAGLGYRLTTGVNDALMKPADFNSPVATLAFMFGWFRQKN